MRIFIDLLKNKNFMLLWVSQIIDQITVNMLSFAILIHLFEHTGSTIATSFVWVAYALPAILVGPIGAVAADVFDRRKMLMGTNLIQSITVFLFALLYREFFYLSYGIVFIYSFFNQFYVPSEASMLPKLVSKRLLPTANGLLFLTVQLGVIGGFISAGLLYEAIGFDLTMIVGSAALFLAFLSVSLLPSYKSKEKIPLDLEKGIAKFFSEIIQGYRFIKNHHKVKSAFGLLIGLQVTLSILVINMPVMASELVNVKPRFAAIAVVVPAGIGALTGTFLIAKLLGDRFRKRHVVEYSVLAISVAILFLGIVVPHLPFWVGRFLSVLIFFVAGISYVGGLIPSLTYLQERTPKDMMGRVFGNMWFISTVATVFPVLFSATITEIFGIKLMISTLGIVGLSAFLISKFYIPDILEVP